MESIDRKLENFVREVELTGRSGLDTVYKNDVTLVIEPSEYSIPVESDWDGATVDMMWFLECARKGLVVSHPAPDASFWQRIWGSKAEPYGYTWRLSEVYECLQDPMKWRRAVLWNPRSSKAGAPCILCYQFQQVEFGRLDVTVSMRSSDVMKVLPQDVLMTRLLLNHVAGHVDLVAGKMTFNIGNAHVYWRDTEYGVEFTIDDGR